MGSILRSFAYRLNPGQREVPNGPIAIDWTHPLARGLIGCYLPGVAGGINIADTATTLTFDTGAKAATAIEGACLASATASHTGMYGTAGAQMTALGDASLYFRGFLTVDTGTAPEVPCWVALTWSNSIVSPYFVCSITNSGFANWAQVQAQWNTGGVIGASGNVDITGQLNNIVSLGACFPVGGNVLVFSNGVQKVSAAFGASAPTKGTGSIFSISTMGTDLTRWSGAACFIACMWNRALSADELTWVDRDPYAFLIPLESDMPALFRAGGVVYTLPAVVGAFAFAGVAATLKSARSFPAAAGAFAFAGLAASLASARSFAAAAGSFAFSGVAALLSLGHAGTVVSEWIIRARRRGRR